jgi:pSer/pThr/pTyr-binding forkhead associated (FHA) protein
MGAALRFKNADIPRQASEKARLKIIEGPDLGATYVVQGAAATIGRGEDCDIVISDLKASRKHAELVLVGEQWNVRDLGSANGIKYNGRATRASVIKSGDTFSLGATTVEFMSPEAGTMLLRALPRSIDQVEADQAALEAQRKRVRSLAEVGSIKSKAPSVGPTAAPKAPPKNLLLIGAAAIVGYVLLTSGDKPAVMKRNAGKKDLAQFLPSNDNATVNHSAEMFLKSGFREYREKNYLRARTQFETALQIDPTNSLAQRYLQNCNQAIDDEVKFELDRGKKADESGSVKEARLHYEAVLRLLYRDQSNPAYIEARDQLAAVEKEEKE